MDFSQNTTNSSSFRIAPNPELEAGEFLNNASPSTELEAFDFNKFFAMQPEMQAESSWLYSDDLEFIDEQQPGYDEIMKKDFTAKSNLNYDSLIKISSNQAGSSSSPFVQSVANLATPISSSQPMFRPPISCIARSPVSLPSLSSATCILDFFSPEMQDFYFQEQGLQEKHGWQNQQEVEQSILTQNRVGREEVNQFRFEQVRQEKAKAEEPNFEQILRQESQGLDKMPVIQVAPQELVQPDQTRSDKISKHLRHAKNARSSNIANFNPAHVYQPLPEPPKSWGGINRYTRQCTFRYTANGELTPQIKFTNHQIEEYLTNHPFYERRNLWLQICPADSGNRYPDPRHSSKCRFENCPVQNNTISKGEYRVAFDEQSWSGLQLDPYHNAGYVHLFCLEKNFDFPLLCKNFNFKADTRKFPQERNKMAITRDYPEMEQIVNDFILNSQSWNGARDNADYYQKTLCYTLTIEQLKRESRKLQAIRERRNGNSIDKHLNNLDILAENHFRKKEGLPLLDIARTAVKFPTVKTLQVTKRKFCHDVEESSSSKSPSRKPQVIKQPSCCLTIHPHTRPQSTKRASQHRDKQRRKSILPMKRRFSDDRYEATGEDSSPPIKKCKISEQESPSSSDYGADISESSPSVLAKSPKALKQECYIVEEKVHQSAAAFKPQQTPKRKSEHEESEGNPNDEFRDLTYAVLKRFGFNKKRKMGGTAGLKTPSW